MAVAASANPLAPGARGDHSPTRAPRTGAAQRLVRWLSKGWTRALVATIWFVAAVGGVLVVKQFMQELQQSVPPVPGSKSDDALRAVGRYFPDKPVQGVLLIESSSGVPFARFVNRSTCSLSAKAALAPGTLNLDYACNNESALGGGCMSKADLGPQLLNVTEKALQAAGLPANATQQMMAYLTQMLPEVEKSLPDTLCPEAVDAGLTQQWLQYASTVSDTLSSQVPHCDHTVQSFLSVPPMPFAQASPMLNMTVNMTGLLPAGSLWSLLRSSLLAESGTSALVAASITACNGAPLQSDTGPEGKDFSAALVTALGKAPPGLSVRASSQSLMLDAINAGVDSTMNLSTMTMPIALAILAIMVKNLRLIICTVINLLCCIAAAILVMYPVAGWLTVNNTAPSLMIAVALAMSIDYSLFLLSRFQKETADGRAPEEAVAIMLATSGKIVLVSGMTLLLCFLTMLILPVIFIATMGVSAAITVFMALAVALTLTPTMLLSFPDFFSSSRRWGLTADGCCRRCRSPAPGDAARSLGAALEADGDIARQRSNEDVDNEQEAELERQMLKSCWPRFGKQTQRCAIPTLLVLLAIGVPFAALSLPRLSHSAGLVPFMPSDGAATKTMTALQDAFGVGALFPVTLLAVPPAGSTSTAQGRATWLQECCEALKAVAAEVNTDPDVPPFLPTAFAGVMIIGGTCATEGLGTWSHVGGDFSATEVMINYQIDPFSADGQRWIVRMRDAFDKRSTVATWYLAGEGPNQMDAADITFAKFPLMVVLMMAVVLLLIGFSFGSVVAPLRAVFCLVWMLGMTFGLAVFVFQDGCFQFLHWPQLGPRAAGAMSWMSPCISCSIVVGLGLDYDVFYSERVLEEWEHGHSEKDAAVRALAATANIISAAGVIMVVAFLSLLLCTTPSLNEIAFLLIVGIIVDCFVTTKVIIPCAVSLLGRRNFWPRLPSRDAAPGAACQPEPESLHSQLVNSRAR